MTVGKGLCRRLESYPHEEEFTKEIRGNIFPSRATISPGRREE
jgi:hypothetical protein